MLAHEYNLFPNIDKSKFVIGSVSSVKKEIAIKGKSISNDFIINLKTGIIKDLYSNKLITEKQMERVLTLLNKKHEN